MKYNTEWFIKRATAIHGDKFDYSLVFYINSVTPVTVIDPVYGPFDIIPANHLRGFSNTNQVRSSEAVRKSRFISKARSIHGNQFDYSKASFPKGKKGMLITIIDNQTGEEFEQTPQWHLLHGRAKKNSSVQTDHIVPLRFLGFRGQFNSFVRQSPMFRFLDSDINRQEIIGSENNRKSDRIVVAGFEYRARQIHQNHGLLRQAILEHLAVSKEQVDQLFFEHYEYMRPEGKLTAFVGPMYASKTTSLIRSAKYNPSSVVYKIDFDNRYSDNDVVSHDGVSMRSKSISTSEEIDFETYSNYFFDEIQFFVEPYFNDSIIKVVERLIRSGKNVWIAGLDMDFRGAPFSYSPLLAMADNVFKLKARCFVCGKPAGKTMKLNPTGESLELGGSDKYEARCNEHWFNRT